MVRNNTRLKSMYKKKSLNKVTNALYTVSLHNPWKNLFDATDNFTPDFMDERKQPIEQKREDFE